MVNTYNSLKKFWKDTIDIVVYETYIDADTKVTRVEEKLLYNDVLCKVSYSGIGTTKDLGIASNSSDVFEITKRVKLFLDKSIDIPMGSKIFIKKDGKVYVYEKSGDPSFFTHHQELYVEASNKL
ncbi:MAG: hypothetical protein ACK5LY_05905 [Lachnospirales bacterium]